MKSNKESNGGWLHVLGEPKSLQWLQCLSGDFIPPPG
jgi:hypothetical protein